MKCDHLVVQDSESQLWLYLAGVAGVLLLRKRIVEVALYLTL